jgi:ABC-type branched-subunit amino acid transport system substrate-binding protein
MSPFARGLAVLGMLAGIFGPGIVPAQILVGQTAGFTGTVAAGVKETSDGAKLYIDHVNARGGVGGERIQLVQLDDKFDAKLAAENARVLITERSVVALFLTRGTPTTQAILPLLDEFKVPLIGPSTGAMVFHDPVHPWLYNVRATYQREAERAVQHLKDIGITRIGLIQQDDSFGADLLQGAMRGLAAAKLQPAFTEKYDRAKWVMVPIALKAVETNVQAVLFMGSGNSVADGVAALRRAGSSAQVITFSNNASAGFVKSLGTNARGVVVMQVFPYERSINTAMVREARDLAAAQGSDRVSPAMLEGFAAAKVLVAGLVRAGPKPTRAKLQQALDAMGKLDIGGLEVSFSPRDHTGLDFVDLSIIGPDGRFIR